MGLDPVPVFTWLEHLKVEFHGPWRTGFYTETAGHTAVVVEAHYPGLWVEDKSTGGADGYTGTTIGAAVFVAQDAMAQRFDLDTG